MEDLNRVTAERLFEIKTILAESVWEEHIHLKPDFALNYNQKLKKNYIKDTEYHILYLSSAIRAGEKKLFKEYINWLKVFFANLPVDEKDILFNLKLIQEYLSKNLPQNLFSISLSYLRSGVEYLKTNYAVIEHYIKESNPLKSLANDYLNYLVEGNKKSAVDLIMRAYESGITIKDIYLNVFQPVQQETGKLWQIGKLSVAQEHFNTAVTQLVMAQFYPHMFKTEKNENKIIVTCIQDELHEIGARMLADIFDMEGWDSYYFGANTPTKELIESIEKYNPQILAVSATMIYNINKVEELINSVKKNPYTSKIKIMVGGYPFNLVNNLWEKLGADGFALNAVDAVSSAKQLIA